MGDLQVDSWHHVSVAPKYEDMAYPIDHQLVCAAFANASCIVGSCFQREMVAFIDARANISEAAILLLQSASERNRGRMHLEGRTCSNLLFADVA